MIKTFILGVFLTLFFSCNGEKNQALEDNASTFEIGTEDWPKKSKANTKTAAILKDWETFNAFELSFDALYNAGNTEDLTLVLEDLIEKQKNLAESKYPDAFDKPQIRSRQKLLHTFILKAKGDLIYRIDAQKSVIQIIESYNTMVSQMNTITSNTLDLKRLLEDNESGLKK